MRRAVRHLVRWIRWTARRLPAATTCRACRTTRTANCTYWCERIPMARPPACPRPEPNKRFQRFSIRILDGVLDARFRKTFQTQTAGIAQPARPALLVRVVATVRQPEIQTQLLAQFDDLALRKMDERRVNMHVRASLYAGLGGQIRHALKSIDEFR